MVKTMKNAKVEIKKAVANQLNLRGRRWGFCMFSLLAFQPNRQEIPNFRVLLPVCC
jgi:hypothetical protein